MNRKETKQKLRKELASIYKKASKIDGVNGIALVDSIPEIRKAIDFYEYEIYKEEARSLKKELKEVASKASFIKGVNAKVAKDIDVADQYLGLMLRGLRPMDSRPSKKSLPLLKAAIQAYKDRIKNPKKN